VKVIQFPRTQLTVDNVFTQNPVKLHVGDTFRFKGPYVSDEGNGLVTLDSSGVVEWAVAPIYLTGSVEGAVSAVFPGTASITSTRWILSIVVT
jgi:hypothetical protein